jgi:hypothetical protein
MLAPPPLLTEPSVVAQLAVPMCRHRHHRHQ